MRRHMKKREEVALIVDFLHAAGCLDEQQADKAKVVVRSALRNIGRQKHEQRKRQKDDYRYYCIRRRRKQMKVR